MCESCQDSAKQLAGRMSMLSLRIQHRWKQGSQHTAGFKDIMRRDVTPPRVGDTAKQECVDFVREVIVAASALEHSMADAASEWRDFLIPEMEAIAILLDDMSRDRCPECPPIATSPA